jgi:N6-L-threonylcarbamoyladenine synthase
MKILGIETSCDETAAALIEGTTQDKPVRILSNVVASSEEFHKKTGGIVPEVAARKQIEFMIPVLSEALRRIQVKDIDAIAVTHGPGLVGSLLIGVETAKALSFAWEKPIFPVNHLVGHLYASWLEANPKYQILNSKQIQNANSKIQQKDVPKFPAIGLVASGGHTDLVLMKSHGALQYLGGTRDDAAGEAFDKIARMLGLGYPGGPAIAKVAMKFQMSLRQSSEQANVKCPIKLPRPMIDSEDYDFSFSGLKTAAQRIINEQNTINKKQRAWLAWEVQEAICEVLVEKLMLVIEEFLPKSVIVAGGVAANSRLRQLLESGIRNQKSGMELFIPPVELCTDNAVCIAAAAFYNQSHIQWRKIKVNPGLSILS